MLTYERIAGNELDFVDSSDREKDMVVLLAVAHHIQVVYNRSHPGAPLVFDVMDFV